MQRIGSPGGVGPQSVSLATPDEIRSHVARVLASPAFRASKRCHRFLDFIITQQLAGNSSTIKERTLATEVFDRAPSWDSGGDDTIVRVGAREVRKRLAQYYNTPEGIQEKLRIELPLGSYVPEIVRVDYAPVPVASALVPIEPVALELLSPLGVPVGKHSRRRWIFAAALITAVIAATLATYSFLRTPTPFDQFWSPYFNRAEPALIGVASPLVYTPSARAYGLNDKRWGMPQLPIVRPLQLDPKQLNGSDFVPVEDGYLAYGDAVATTSMQLLLARRSREAHLRFASRLEFAEFRDTPVILVGAFTNRWTIELTQHFRYHFGYDPHWFPAILDSKTKQIWSISQKQENGTSPEDYFLICRLPTSPSGSPMLIAAGVEQFGTEAAGRFLADPARLNSVLKVFGKDWQNKKLEFVMHAKVIDNSPAAPELVAFYIW